MPIFGSDGAPVGTVHRVSGVRIIVNHIGASDAHQHVIPMARVAEVTDRVVLNCPAVEARAEGAGEGGGGQRSFPGAVWLGVALFAIALIYGAWTLIARGPAAPKPAPSPAPSIAAPVAEAANDTAKRPSAPAIPARPAGPVEANAASLGGYLASDDIAPQRFALDGFAPGGTTLDAAGLARVREIAGVLTTHLNTKIKLAASGGIGLRRAEAIKRLLAGLGVADYRITTGAAKAPVRGASGVELIVLVK